MATRVGLMKISTFQGEISFQQFQIASVPDIKNHPFVQHSGFYLSY